MNLLANVIDIYIYPICIYFEKFKDFKSFYTIKKFVSGGSMGERGHISMIWYIDPWLVVHRKVESFANLDSYGLAIVLYKHHRAMFIW